jgi:hypothetical protein
MAADDEVKDAKSPVEDKKDAKAPDEKDAKEAKESKGAKAETKDHFAGSTGEGRNPAASAERRRALDDGLSAYGSRTSGVIIVGDGMTFNGGVIGGDSSGGVQSGQSGPVLTEITGRVIADLAQVYVEPGGYAELGRPLVRHRVLLLGTRPRWGNTATAIRLLAGYGPVKELRFTGRVAELPVDSLPRDSGFILEAADARALAALRLQDLEELDQRLAAIGSRLVVITDSDRVAEHGTRPVWRAVSSPPGAYDLALSHLDHRLSSREQAVELLEQAGVAAELKDTAPGAYDVHRLVELASDLAEAAAGHCTLQEAKERYEDRADRAVEEWFDDEVTTPADRALVLALAVLNGLPYDAVSRAAGLLESPLAELENAKPGPPKPRRLRLKAARARLATETRQTRYGAATLEVASFIDDAYPARILRHYWHEHDYGRELMMSWLGDVAEDVEVLVNTRAATAVGYLATFAFDIVRRQVIGPWAISGRDNERELAVAALALPAREPDTAGRTVKLVSDWASRNGEARLAAARALGSSVGSVLHDGPDAAMARLAKGAGGDCAIALGESITELLAEADEDRSRELLGMLDAWSQETRNGRQAAGVLGFLEVAWTLRVYDDNEVSWPALLWLAAEDEAAAQIIARLWSNALIAPDADDGVRVVLRTWAQSAEHHPEQRPAFVRLFTAVPRTPRQADLLRRHAQTLRTGKPPSPDTARKLLDALTKES